MASPSLEKFARENILNQLKRILIFGTVFLKIMFNVIFISTHRYQCLPAFTLSNLIFLSCLER